MTSAPATPACVLYGRCGGCQLQHLRTRTSSPSRRPRDRSPVGRRARGRRAASPRRRRTATAPSSPRTSAPAPRPAARDRLSEDRTPARDDRRSRAARSPPRRSTPRLPSCAPRCSRAGPDYRRGASLLVREAASGVTVDPRARDHRARSASLSLQFFARRLLPEQSLPAPPSGRPTSPTRRGRRRALPGRRLLRQRPVGLAAARALRARARRGGEPSARPTGRAPTPPATAATNAMFLAADATAMFGTVPFAGADTA